MSTNHQVAGPSGDNFTAIFNAASTEYYSVTGKRLETHPLAAQIDTCRNPEAVSNLLRTQAQAFSKFRQADEKLMAWLDPMVHILFTFSATLGEGIGLVGRLIHSALLFLIKFSAFLAGECYLHWDWSLARGKSPPSALSTSTS